jgi:hypothetical protein
MEKLVLLIYGVRIPPAKHIEKIAKKYGHYYLRDKDRENFDEGDFYEVRIDDRYTGLDKRNGGYSQITAVRKEYLPRFIHIFKSIGSNVALCSEDHEHPTVSISGMEFEGYCYYLKDQSYKIMFLDACWIEKERKKSNEELYRLWSEKKLDFKNPDWSLFSPKTESYDLTEMEWYRAHDKRWFIVEANKNTQKAFEKWVKGLVQMGSSDFNTERG